MIEKYIVGFITGITLTFGIRYIINKTKELKVKRELKYRQKDTRLAKYYSEMINERNDGWTKNHYKNLYDERLIFLKKSK